MRFFCVVRIRRHHNQRETLVGLGVNKIGRAACVPDTPATRGMIAKVKHLVQVTLRVTFDSNTYRQAVDPRRSRRDASTAELRRIHAALKDGRIRGYLSETLDMSRQPSGSPRRQCVVPIAPCKLAACPAAEDENIEVL